MKISTNWLRDFMMVGIFFAAFLCLSGVTWAVHAFGADPAALMVTVPDEISNEEYQIYSRYLQTQKLEAPLPGSYALGALDLSGYAVELPLQAEMIQREVNKNPSSLYNVFWYSGYREGQRKKPFFKKEAFEDFAKNAKQTFSFLGKPDLSGKRVLTSEEFAMQLPYGDEVRLKDFRAEFFVLSDSWGSSDLMGNVALSRIGFDEDKTQAVFYATYDGIGEYVVFVKDDGQWVLAVTVWYPLLTKIERNKY